MRLLVLDDPAEEVGAAMARDHTLALRDGSELGEEPFEVVLRLHGWARPALTYGRGQRPDAEELDEARRTGLDAAVRPTGGGRLLHLPGDLAVTLFVRGPLPVGGFRGAAKSAARLIAEGLAESGLPARLAEAAATEGRATRAEICFARKDDDEVVSGGTKVAGVALARLAGGALVQAAIPLVRAEGEASRLVETWDPPREGASLALAPVDRTRLAASLPDSAMRALGAVPLRASWWDVRRTAEADSLAADRYPFPQP